MELLAYEKKISKMSLSELTVNDFINLREIIIKMKPQERQEQYERIAEVFFKVLSITNYEEITELQINIIIELCDMIAVSNIEFNKGSYAFIKFLYHLKSDRQYRIFDNDDELLKQYSLFGDIIDQVSGVFSIKKDGCLLFPLHEILAKLAMDFECNNESLVRLAIALQLFSHANECLQLSNNDISKRILHIADTYNIKFLMYLLNGGRLLTKNNENYIKNGTMIFQHNNSFLIRNISSSYFDEDCEKEIDDSKNPIAYFVEINKPNNGTLTNFIELLNRENQYLLKLDVLDQILNTRNYNILYGDLLFVDNNSSTFLGFLNPFGKNDEYIIYNNKEFRSNLNDFLDLLKEHVNNVRDSILFKDNIDVLTLDFLISIFDFVPDNIIFSLKSIYEDERNDFFQNLIIKKCFEEVKTQSIELYSEMIFKYASYCSNYLAEIKIFTNMTDIKGLVMPYRLYFDFSDMNEFYEFEKMRIFGDGKNNNIIWGKVKYEENPLPSFIFLNTGKSVSLIDYEGNDSNLFYGENTFECFIDECKNVAYYDHNQYISYKEIKRLIEWNDKAKFIYNDISINEQDLDNTVKIIDLVKLNAENYTHFNLEHAEGKNLVIPLYKLLWHFVLHSWECEHIKNFFELVLRGHYTDSILDYRKSFELFAEIEESDGSTLYVAKESSENQGTLYLLYAKYIIDYGHRYRLGYIFDAKAIRDNLQEINNEYYFRSKKIEKIVIVTDMLMNGKAMIDALKFYLKNEGNGIKKFVEINDLISSILEKNSSIKIEVVSIWGYERSIANINRDFSDFNISIDIRNIIPETYRCNDKTKSIISNLYAEQVTNGLCCVFRYNNMPAASVFPKYVTRTSIIGGIFNRKNEIS